MLPKGSRGRCFLVSSSSWWLWPSLACGCVTPAGLQPHVASPCSPVSLLSFPVLSMTLVIGFRAHTDTPGRAHLKIRVSAKALFPRKSSCTASSNWDVDTSS